MGVQGGKQAWRLGGRECALLLAACLALASSACDELEQNGPQFVWPDAGAAGSAGGAPPAPAPISRLVPGRWAIVASEMDATVVEIDSQGRGRGCQAGWDDGTAPGNYSTEYCGPVSGRVDGDQVLFDLALPAHGDALHYAIDGTLSAKGTRIGGTHRITSAGMRFDESFPGSAIYYDAELYPGPFPVGSWPDSAGRWYDAVVTTPVAHGPYLPGQEYRLRRSFSALGGDFGEFLGSELHFEPLSDDELIVNAGPVDKTLDD